MAELFQKAEASLIVSSGAFIVFEGARIGRDQHRSMHGCKPAQRTLAWFGRDARPPALPLALARAAAGRRVGELEVPQSAWNRAIHNRLNRDVGCSRVWSMKAAAGRDASAIASRLEAE